MQLSFVPFRLVPVSQRSRLNVVCAHLRYRLRPVRLLQPCADIQPHRAYKPLPQPSPRGRSGRREGLVSLDNLYSVSIVVVGNLLVVYVVTGYCTCSNCVRANVVIIICICRNICTISYSFCGIDITCGSITYFINISIGGSGAGCGELSYALCSNSERSPSWTQQHGLR